MPNFANIAIEMPDIELKNFSILRINIDNSWDPSNFCSFFEAIDLLYASKYLTYTAIKAANDFIANSNYSSVNYMQYSHTPLSNTINSIRWRLSEIIKIEMNISNVTRFSWFPFNEDKDGIIIKRVQYASPGITDFLGIAGILKEIKEALIHYFPNGEDKEKVEILKQQKIELKIKNLKSIGFSDIEIRAILLQEDVKIESLSRFIQNGLITEVKVIDGE